MRLRFRRRPISAVDLELLRADAGCPYHSVWPCGDCDDCDVLAEHGPDFIIPLCPGWSRCTCLRGTAGHWVAARLQGLNDGPS